MKEWH